MHTHTLVAVFPSRAAAEEVRRELTNIGVSNDDVRISELGGRSAEGHEPQGKGGFWDWLFGTDVPESDKSWYETNLDESRTAISVRVTGEEARSEVETILGKHSPLSMEEDDSVYRSSDTSEFASEKERSEVAGEATGATEEARIPLIKEELEVGKRSTEQRHRIRIYPVERQVQQKVELRDETVVIERRPLSHDPAATPGDLEAREVEVIERHEEPVVAKTTRAVEEVVVRKDVRDRTETVEDTVRETKVEVDQVGESRKRGARG
jgi:stress response protein YsnF